MTEYTKIETVFERDTEGTKKLIEGVFRSSTVEYLKDNEWIWTEKIDGTNIGVIWDGHRVSFQGRTEKAVIPKPLLKSLEELFGGETNEEIFEQVFGNKNVILYGEGYGNKIQKCGKDYLEDTVSFILFDIYLPVIDIWLTRNECEEIAKTLGIDIVPIVGIGSIYEAVDFVKRRPKSTIGTADMEGVVARPRTDLRDRFGDRVIVKIKARDFI